VRCTLEAGLRRAIAPLPLCQPHHQVQMAADQTLQRALGATIPDGAGLIPLAPGMDALRNLNLLRSSKRRDRVDPLQVISQGRWDHSH